MSIEELKSNNKIKKGAIMIDKSKFVEVYEGIWYEVDTGLPWSSRQTKFKKLKIRNTGYYEIRIGKKLFLWHRLVWEHFNGNIPKDMQVDHKNNVRSDSRIENLQLLSNKDNSRCRKMQSNNTSGLCGVRYDKERRKWIAQCTHNGKKINLGRYFTKEEAHKAYINFKIDNHGIESLRKIV